MTRPTPSPAGDSSGTAAAHPALSPVPAFTDNYIWLLRDRERRRAIVVDPGDAQPVLDALRAQSLELAAVLVTHHHPDHVGGLAMLREAYPQAVVHGPAGSPARGLDRTWTAGEVLEPDGFDARFEVIGVPGHTLDHIAWYAPRIGDDPRPVLFCGDTLFAGGCGRVFEGTFAQMADSLGRLASLPDATLVCCAHEYTASNLRFARAVEPDSDALARRVQDVAALREDGRPTVPSTLAAERATNPFLRAESPSVRRAAADRLGREPADAIETFATLRAWKDVFRG